MTRQEAIEHWKFVVQSVLKAEDKLKDQLKGIIQNDMSQEEKADKYFGLIAEEILKSTPDEELNKM